MDHSDTLKQIARTVNEISYDYSSTLRNATIEQKQLLQLHKKIQIVNKIASALLKLQGLESPEDD